MNLRKPAMLLLGSVAVLLGTAVRGEKADPRECHCLSWIEEVGEAHAFPVGGGSAPYHCAPTACHDVAYQGFCSAHHDGCGPNGPNGLDVSEILTSSGPVGLAVHEGVVFNMDRQELQVVGCDGRITGSVPVSDSEREAVLIVRAALGRQLV